MNRNRTKKQNKKEMFFSSPNSTQRKENSSNMSSSELGKSETIKNDYSSGLINSKSIGTGING